MKGEVEYYGKPYSPIFEYASQFTNGKVVMVGDTPWTDVLGGNLFGIDTILTLTGVSESFMERMSPNIPTSERIQNLLGEISSKMTHFKLRDFNPVPTHIVESFAG
jgi:ribonucleotide monophosphatase NagD (HAD superfamily)